MCRLTLWGLPAKKEYEHHLQWIARALTRSLLPGLPAWRFWFILWTGTVPAPLQAAQRYRQAREERGARTWSSAPWLVSRLFPGD